MFYGKLKAAYRIIKDITPPPLPAVIKDMRFELFKKLPDWSILDMGLKTVGVDDMGQGWISDSKYIYAVHDNSNTKPLSIKGCRFALSGSHLFIHERHKHRISMCSINSVTQSKGKISMSQIADLDKTNSDCKFVKTFPLEGSCLLQCFPSKKFLIRLEKKSNKMIVTDISKEYPLTSIFFPTAQGEFSIIQKSFEWKVSVNGLNLKTASEFFHPRTSKFSINQTGSLIVGFYDQRLYVFMVHISKGWFFDLQCTLKDFTFLDNDHIIYLPKDATKLGIVNARRSDLPPRPIINLPKSIDVKEFPVQIATAKKSSTRKGDVDDYLILLRTTRHFYTGTIRVTKKLLLA